MTCPDCLRPIDDSHLACAYCANAKSYQAVLDSQKHVVGYILKSKCSIKIARPHYERGWHILIADYAQTWCGRPTSPKHWTTRRERVDWAYVNGNLSLHTCEDCQRVIEETAETQDSEAA